MNTLNTRARIAGLLYLGVILCGLFSLMYVPSQLNDWNNPAAMVNNIREHQLLFRLGVFIGIVGYIFFLLLPLALYKLLSDVNKTHAILMVAFAVVSVPISLSNMLHKFSVLTLLGDSKYLSAIAPEQLTSQIVTHLDFYNDGNLLASIFWGLWLFPFGYLVYRSGFLPKVIGVLLMVGCFGYVLNFMGNFLLPGYDQLIIAKFITAPASLGELSICAWLLIAGVRKQKEDFRS